MSCIGVTYQTLLAFSAGGLRQLVIFLELGFSGLLLHVLKNVTGPIKQLDSRYSKQQTSLESLVYISILWTFETNLLVD